MPQPIELRGHEKTLFDEYSILTPEILLPVPAATASQTPLNFVGQLRRLDTMRASLACVSCDVLPAHVDIIREYFQSLYVLQVYSGGIRRTCAPLSKLWRTMTNASERHFFANTLEAEVWWAGLMFARCLVEMRDWWSAALLYTRLMCERTDIVGEWNLPSTLRLDRDFCLLMHYHHRQQRITPSVHPLALLYKCKATLTRQRTTLLQENSPVLPLLYLTLSIRAEWPETRRLPPLSVETMTDAFVHLLAATALPRDKNGATNTAVGQIFDKLANRRRRRPANNHLGQSIPLSQMVVLHSTEPQQMAPFTTQEKEEEEEEEEDAILLMTTFENTHWRPDIATLEDASHFFKVFVPQLL